MRGNISFIGGPKLEGRHTAKYLVGPQYGSVFCFVSIYFGSLGVRSGYINLSQCFTLKSRGKIKKAYHYKNSDNGKVNAIALEPVTHLGFFKWILINVQK